MRRRSAVIFDMDGVLVDTEPLYVEINRHLFAELGIDVSLEQNLSYVGIAADRMWSAIREQFGLRQSVDELIRFEKENQFRRLRALAEIPEVPGVRALLAGLSERNARMAIATSSSHQTIDVILSKVDMRRCFAAVVSGEDVRRGKPSPDIFLAAAERLGAAPEECVVVEDSPHGIAGGKSAGMTCVGFANPNSGRQDLSGADVVVPDFSPESRRRVLALIG